MDIKKLGVRTISGIVYVAVVIACTLAGNAFVAVLGCLFGVLATIELSSILNGSENKFTVTSIFDMTVIFLLLSPFIFYEINFHDFGEILILLGIIAIIVRIAYSIFDKSRNPLSSLCHSIFIYCYIGVPLLVMNVISESFSSKFILALFIFIWVNDTGAFLVGSNFGRHRLLERISPKKSWEGFWGGFLFTVVAGAVIGFLFGNVFSNRYISPLNWMILAAFVSVVATFGDLIESMIKRNVHVKDSGNLIPGHGGILDRIDSLLFVLPTVVWLLLIIK